jgi:hypothetical protein
MGTFNQFRVVDFRNPMPPFWIFARIEFEQEGDYPVVIEFRTIEGQRIFQVKGIAQLRTMPERPGHPPTLVRPVANLKFKVDNFRLPRDGLYEIAFFHNDQLLQTVQIEAIVQRPGFVQ